MWSEFTLKHYVIDDTNRMRDDLQDFIEHKRGLSTVQSPTDAAAFVLFVYLTHLLWFLSRAVFLMKFKLLRMCIIIIINVKVFSKGFGSGVYDDIDQPERRQLD